MSNHGITETEAEARLHAAAKVFKCLSNPHRLTIFLRIASCMGVGTSCETNDAELAQYQFEHAKALGLAPSTVSHHFKELREAGLVRMARQGKIVRCWIDAATLELARETLGASSFPPAPPKAKTE
jgi:ArsR family transcriptional regulator, arsenate/arsenite/antimonite-responsive transcriptional repressor